MRDPNSVAFKRYNTLMASGAMVGTDRPFARVTAQKHAQAPFHSNRPGPWRSVLFPSHEDTAVEIPNETLMTVDIDRSHDQDSATCTIVLRNMGVNDWPEDPDGGVGTPGYMTFNRGEIKKKKTHSIFQQIVGPDGFATEWEYRQNEWHDVFIPNTIIRTYQGYGSDNLDEFGNFLSPGQNRHPHKIWNPSTPDAWGFPTNYVSPVNDTKLMKTGTWLIDKVSYAAASETSGGTITIECRDMAKLLLEQFIYPPMLPLDRFPLIYCPATANHGHKEVQGRNVARYHASSVDPWYGHNGSVHGHRGSDAFDGRPGSFWMSVGNDVPNADYSYEWVDCTTGGHSVNEIFVHLWGNNYEIYVGVMENGTWQGTSTVPYNPSARPAAPNDSNEHYVKKITSGSAQSLRIRLPRTYKADRVRLTFTNLYHSPYGPYYYRAGVREMQVYLHTPNTYVASTIGRPGYIQGWEEPIKELCGWAGFTWVGAPQADKLLGTDRAGDHLRVWGDFEKQVNPVVCTPADYFMNKSFMQGIRQISDFLGTVFYVDEDGAAILRQPNIWSGGNFVDDPNADVSTPAYLRDFWPVEFHEDANLVTYTATVDDSQVRSEVLVVGYNPDVLAKGFVAGGYVLGKNPVTGHTSAIDFTNVLAGQQRIFVVPGEASQFMQSELECQRMAELVGLFILFSYRQGSLGAPCHPGLQLGDQIRIFERTTHENNVHYVSALSTHFDAGTGEYTMTVTTHWLGEDPDTKWFVKKAQLTPAVLELPAIAARIGKDGVDGFDPNQTPPYNVQAFV